MSKAKQPKVVNLADIKVACANCSLYELCLPLGVKDDDLDELESIIARRKLPKGHYLFRQNQEFNAIYALRTGSLKTFTLNSDGSEQITGFHLPGELVGLDAISSAKHPSNARALESVSYCELPFDQLEDLSSKMPSLQRQLLRIMSNEIREDTGLAILLGNSSAEERLASLLLSLSQRFQHRGYSSEQFNLSMSRTDIGNYLGLAVETISRLFTRMQDHGILNVNGKLIDIIDMDALKALTNTCPSNRADPSTA
ncbi:MAG TPA: fumarate/nitrate reduction transcriptional regulator Fnr [Gammaproteobacteria bacterium]|nr:fumarate/nitrate reduction transcriptional regulator Fnr [Gammaproteobacteria bacterium]